MPAKPTPIAHPTPRRTAGAVERAAAIIERWKTHRANRTRARLISPHNRRMLAQWLRRTANHSTKLHPLAGRREALLHYRVAAVRTELLQIAATLEHTHNPEPARMTALHHLLANGCDSPLYNADIHISELHATLHYIRSGL